MKMNRVAVFVLVLLSLMTLPLFAGGSTKEEPQRADATAVVTVEKATEPYSR